MKEQFESPFDPKWEMTPEQIAEVFAHKDKSEEDIKGPEGEVKPEEPELTADNNTNQVETYDMQVKFFKLLLAQNYLALLVSLQHRLNKLDGNEDLAGVTVALKGIRANAKTLYDLALKSNDRADVVAAKDVLLDLAKKYNQNF